MIWLTAAATAGGLAIVVIGILGRAAAGAAPTPMEERAAFYSGPAATSVPDELQRLSFWERIVQPQVSRASSAIAARTPARYLADTERALLSAGNPLGVTAEGFLAMRFVSAVAIAGLGLAVGVAVQNAVLALLLAVAGAALGWAAVGLLLRQAIQDRRRAVLRSLPDVVDFLVVAVDAGLSFDLALGRVVEKFKNPLTQGFAQALAEVQLGRHRLEALEELGRRTGVPELMAFVQMVVSSERMGVPIAHVLRLQSQELRWRRGEWARKLAAEAPVKMTIPMVVFIFPTLWLVLLGPSLIRLLAGGI